MYLQENFFLDRENGFIGGVEDFGVKVSMEDGTATSTRSFEIYNHALTFMMQSLLNGKYLPLQYGYTSGAAGKFDLKDLIRQVVTDLQKAGFVVVGLVSDQGPTNRGAINELLRESRCARQGQPSADRKFMMSTLHKDICCTYCT